MRHDVFISFRGEDVRRTFLSHLIQSLDKKGIRSVTSASSYPSKIQAVKDSRVVIPVISKSSTSLEYLWLKELDKIIASESTQVPVFLRVDPQDVLMELDPVMVPEDTYEALETVKYWLDHHVMSKSGFHSKDCEDDSKLVDQITCFVSSILTQDSGSRLSQYYIPIPWLDWFVDEPDALDSRLVSPVVNTVVTPVVTPLVKIEEHGTDRFRKTSSTIDLTDDELEMSRRKEYVSSLESLWLSETVNESSWWDDVIRRIPFLHRSEPSETVNESSWWDEVIRRIPFLHRSEPSETVNVLPSVQRFTRMITTKMDTLAEYRIMAHHVKEVLSMLQLGGSTKEVRTIGIYGIEGVGKTTLSKSVYQSLSRQFHHRFYITNFSRKGRSLHEILSNETVLNSTTSFTELVGRKVLVVADSVDDIKQLKDFEFEVSLFGPGSRVILITRDRSLLSQYGVQHIYNVTCPGYDHSVQIFSHFAFNRTDPVSGFERLIGRAVEVAGRIPLALKMLGTYLNGKERDEWESTLLKLEESNTYIKAHALQYIIESYASRRNNIVLEHEEDEPNRFPSYSFTLR